MPIFLGYLIAGSFYTTVYLGLAHLVYLATDIPHAATVVALGISTWLLSDTK